MAPRYLIVNADDFGQSAGVNAGIVEAHRRGIVTSASLMVRWPAALEASMVRHACPALGIGLHLDFGEWYLDGAMWQPHYEVVALDDAAAVAREIKDQLAAFERLIGRPPTHIDSHQHVHLREPVRGLVENEARRLGVPLRRAGAIRYCGDFYGQDENGGALPERITVEALLPLLEHLPAGVTEICCHPAAADDLDTMYAAERLRELEVLCDPRLRRALADFRIELRSFADLPRPLA